MTRSFLHRLITQSTMTEFHQHPASVSREGAVIYIGQTVKANHQVHLDHPDILH